MQDMEAGRSASGRRFANESQRLPKRAQPDRLAKDYVCPGRPLLRFGQELAEGRDHNDGSPRSKLFDRFG